MYKNQVSLRYCCVCGKNVALGTTYCMLLRTGVAEFLYLRVQRVPFVALLRFAGCRRREC